MNFNYIKLYQNDVDALKVVGIFVNTNNNDSFFKYNIYFINIFFFGVINALIGVNWILLTDGLKTFCEIGYLEVALVGIQMKSICLYINRHKFGNLITDLNNEICQPKGDAEMVILRNVYNRYGKIRHVFLGLILVTTILTWLMPVITGEQYIPCWYPPSIHSFPAVKIIVYIHQYITLSFMGIVHNFTDLILGGLLTFVGLQCDLLSHRVTLLGQLEPVNRDDWIRCIRHKKFISGYVNDINEVFGMMYFVYIFTSTILLVMAMFLMSVTELSYEFYYQFLVFIAASAILLLPCSFATYMTTKSENIPNAAYNCNFPDATNSFKKELSFFIACTQRPIQFYAGGYFVISVVTFGARKVLLLYLHNSEHPFSKMFSENLGRGEMAKILHRSFYVLGWDVEEPKYHNALVSALGHHVNLSVIADLVTNKVSVGLCILPINGTISVFLCLRENIVVKNIIKNLKRVETVFQNEITKEKELKKLESEKSNENDWGSEKMHSIWADLLGNRDYDSFDHDQHTFLREKIGFALKGPPQKADGYDDKTKAQVEELYNIVKRESNKIAEFKDQVVISFIYNCLEPLPHEKVKRGKKFPDYNPQTDINPVPIFVLRKCRGSDNPCRVFIDDGGRVYQNWTGYLTKNKYPKYKMIVPLDGRYQVNNDIVLLEKHLSAACHLDSKLLQVGGIVSTVAGLASGAVLITAATIPAIPVAFPVLITAGVVGAVAGVWAIGRSSYTLIDRKLHKESLSFANSEARGAYITIVAGSLEFIGAGATKAVTQFARRGVNIGKGARYLVKTVRILRFGAGGARVINLTFDALLEHWTNDENPLNTCSALTTLQLSTSVLFFGHVVYNFRDAQTLIDETLARVLKDYYDSLRSNRHRKMFNKLMKETLSTHGDGARGRAEVISAIRNIQNKDEVFAALARNNRAMNRAGIRFSAEGDEIRLSGVAVNMNEFIGLNKNLTETFLSSLFRSQLSQQPTTTNTTTISDLNMSLKIAVSDILSDIQVDITEANFNQLLTLTSELLIFCSEDIKTKVVNAVRQAVTYVFSQLARSVADEIDKIIPKDSQYFNFLNIGISFFSQLVDEWEQKYQTYERTEDPEYYDPLFEHINHLYGKRTVAFFEFVVRNSFSGDSLTKAVLEKITGYVTAWITRVIVENEENKEREQNRLRHSAGFNVKKVNCPNCGGYYFQNAQ